MNILGNAIDALEQSNQKRSPAEIEAKPATITIQTDMISGSDAPGSVIIRIRDNGPGIPPALLNRLFDPFFTTKPVGKGTGLGLSISYQIIVEKHHGILKCTSEPGNGAEFWIEIPVRQASLVRT